MKLLEKLSIFIVLILPLCNIYSQNKEFKDTVNVIFNEAYGLSDFVSPHKKLPVRINSLVIEFKKDGKFQAFSGHDYYGDFTVNDSTNIKFVNARRTLQAITIRLKSGFEYNPDLFFDSLFICNRSEIIDNEIRFYRNYDFKIALKPYHDLIFYPNNRDLTRLNLMEVKVNYIDSISGYTIIDSEIQKQELGVVLVDSLIDFEKKNLIIIESSCIQENKLKELKRSSKFYRKHNKTPYYPVSYGKLYFDSLSGITYLDIVNTYQNSNYIDSSRRGKYTGFITDKFDIEKFKISITYKN